jgi:hypothetical protein
VVHKFSDFIQLWKLDGKRFFFVYLSKIFSKAFDIHAVFFLLSLLSTPTTATTKRTKKICKLIEKEEKTERRKKIHEAAENLREGKIRRRRRCLSASASLLPSRRISGDVDSIQSTHVS